MDKAVLLIFLFKTFDCAFSTLKNIFLYKGRHFIQAFCVTMANLMNAVSLLYVFNSDFWSGLIALGLATFIGSYVPSRLMDHLEKDKLYVYEITSDTLEAGHDFILVLQNNNIAFTYDPIKDKNLNDVLRFNLYSETKKQSTIIEGLRPRTFKYNCVPSIITKGESYGKENDD